jgi:hypothetical protein
MEEAVPCLQAGTETVGIELFVLMAFPFTGIETLIEPDEVRAEFAELTDA